MITDEMQNTSSFKNWVRREKQIYLVEALISFGLGAYHFMFVSSGTDFDTVFRFTCVVGGIYFLWQSNREASIINRIIKRNHERQRVLFIVEILVGLLSLVFAITLPPDSFQFLEIIFGSLFIGLGILTCWRINRLKLLMDSTPASTNFANGNL